MLRRVQVSMALKCLPRLIVADWDETITVKDTTSTVAHVAYQAKPTFQPLFQHYVDVYLKLYESHVLQWKRSGHKYPISDLVEEEEFQKGMAQVERSSIQAMETDGLFKDVSIDAFSDVTVDINPDFVGVGRFCAENDIPLVILSINWTETIIQNTLAKHCIAVAEILVNRLETRHDGTLTGKWNGQWDIRTALDKRNWVLKLMTKYDIMTSRNAYYVGDSSTDLLAMLETDVPVMVPLGRGLQKAQDLGLTVSPLKNGFQKELNRIYKGTWKDVLRCLETGKEQR